MSDVSCQVAVVTAVDDHRATELDYEAHVPLPVVFTILVLFVASVIWWRLDWRRE